ncbi:hypothetical protein [Paenisporosarcina cavernae]|uniref:Uncharacterized protein n=1 Tax=Paenisporosarcina cavernae TaxID=2320858 RepID=A0A385YPP3_9BACL|nr:hypothetical protein [Paenisporosarcina cavernae]AYC28695.1 hypothetical protein D3873_01970 [Paenisporosarcina cavernae]
MNKCDGHVRELIEKDLSKLDSQINDANDFIKNCADEIERQKERLKHLREKRNQYISYLEESE